jgi:hypothetical protein
LDAHLDLRVYLARMETAAGLSGFDSVRPTKVAAQTLRYAVGNVDEAYHYPADLMSLMVEVIPRLCRSKRDVLTWFRGAGIPSELLADLESQLRAAPDKVWKFDQARTVLTRINEKGDRYLRQRREVLKRVVGTEDFSTCWPQDRLEAQGLVAQIRSLVEKVDAFTRMSMERDREAAEVRRRREEDLALVANRSRELARLHDSLAALFSEEDAHRRGKVVESIMNQYFRVESVLVREAFSFREAVQGGPLEQVDGVIELDGHLYLVELKWWNHRLGPADVAHHMVKVGHRGGVRGLVVSASGFTDAAITTCRDELIRGVFVLAELRELILWMEREHPLRAALKQKVDHAMIDKNPLFIVT